MSDVEHKDIAMPSIEDTASNGPSGLGNTKNAIYNNTSAASNTVSGHPLTQSITNGPVVDNVKDQTAKTQAEFSNLAASRTTPATPAATGQQLTHYHSFFSSLLSWNNPRASAIAYGAVVLFIFAARYLDILRYTFKVTWMTLGVTLLAEVAGRAVLGTGLTSKFRPRKYFTVSKSTLDSILGDVQEFINFFVIESQRIVFAENVFVSAAAFVAAFISYFLIKVVPIWGLSLIATSVVFLTPLIYKTNKEFIDEHLAQLAKIANQQTEQVRQIASQHAARATETTKQYVGEYSSKAQEMIGNARGRSASPLASAKPAKVDPVTADPVVASPAPAASSIPLPKEDITSAYKSEDFPVAPVEEFKTAAPVGETVSALKEDEPLIIS